MFVSMFSILIMSLLCFMAFQKIVDITEREKSDIVALKSDILSLHIELSRFLYDKQVLENQMIRFSGAIENKNRSLKAVESLIILPKLNSQIEKAVSSILILEDQQKSSQTSLLRDFSDLQESVKEFRGQSSSFCLNGEFTVLDYRNPGFPKLQKSISLVKKEMGKLDTALYQSEKTLSEQYEIINRQKFQIQKAGFYFSSSFVLISLISSLIMTSIFSRKLSDSIVQIERSISLMATGDLRNEIKGSRNDEIGTLGRNINDFREKLNSSLNQIKLFSLLSENIKQELISTATETASSSIEISSSIDSINGQMTSLASNISHSGSQLSEIFDFSKNLDNDINTQIQMIEGSSHSISKMMGSIDCIMKQLSNNHRVIETLVETAQSGDQKLNETTDNIEEIHTSISEINEIARIIQNIASKTNLLAMNAAIEAAHAGEKGKGFAVVADEIRKLSEASSLNSKEITKNLNKIISRIEKAAESGKVTKSAFAMISLNIHEVSTALIEISSTTSQINTGSSIIRQNMIDLSSNSVKVQNKSKLMKGSAQNVKQISDNIYQISETVRNGISELNCGYKEVTEVMNGLKTISDQAGEISKDINDELIPYKTIGEYLVTASGEKQV